MFFSTQVYPERKFSTIRRLIRCKTTGSNISPILWIVLEKFAKIAKLASKANYLSRYCLDASNLVMRTRVMHEPIIKYVMSNENIT